MDILINDEDKTEINKWVSLSFSSYSASLLGRIKWCWKMLTGSIGLEHKFVVREEDIEDLAGAIRGGNG